MTIYQLVYLGTLKDLKGENFSLNHVLFAVQFV